jgi:hypothetical protein
MMGMNSLFRTVVVSVMVLLAACSGGGEVQLAQA